MNKDSPTYTEKRESEVDMLECIHNNSVGVSKNQETRTGIRKLGNRETGEPIQVSIAKKPKTGDPGSGPDFWHQIKTGKPESGAYI